MNKASWFNSARIGRAPLIHVVRPGALFLPRGRRHLKRRGIYNRS